MTYVLIALPLIAIIASVFSQSELLKKGKKAKTAFKSQVIAFAAVAVLTFAIPMVASATTAAEDATPATTAAASEEATAADTQDKKLPKWYGSTSCWLRNSYLRYRWWYRCCCCCSSCYRCNSEDPKVFGKAFDFRCSW